MKDLFLALMGRNHCPWCTLKPDTWAERRFGKGSGPRSEQPIPDQIYWTWMDVNFRLKIWRLGERFHYRFHESAAMREYYNS